MAITKKIVSLSLVLTSMLTLSTASFAQIPAEPDEVEPTVIERTVTVSTDLPTVVVDGYTVIIRGSARPDQNHLGAEEVAVKMVQAFKAKYPYLINDCSIYMFYLDHINAWSVHFDTSYGKNFEYLVDARK